MLYDLFISHASEDKDNFVRPLAERLRSNNVEVWYDEFSLNTGDSLRESIDKGLSKSRFGLVVLSHNFFRKNWPQRELNALFARNEKGIILPIWHEIEKNDILKYSPLVADIVALNSNRGLDFIIQKVLKIIHPQESPLIVARDELIRFGLKPPVVTDEWWLDVVEASNRVPNGGAFIPERSEWGRWTLPLPNFDSKGADRGLRLAWVAMQLQWEEQAEKQKITQITHPNKVLDFINKMPGLKDICHEYPLYLSEYAPQLTIRRFGGEFENDFEKTYQKSIEEHQILRGQKSPSGAGLTINKEAPLCGEEIALRHPNFGNYKPSVITSQFLSGQLWGPHIKYYDNFEYLVWFLSSNSDWLPKKTKNFLIKGMKEWPVWGSYPDSLNKETGAEFMLALFETKNFNQFKLTEKVNKSLIELIQKSIHNLNLNEKYESILDKFLNENFIEEFIKKENRRKNNNKR